MIIMVLICLGCGFLFLGIGKYAIKSSKPMGFWANGKSLDPAFVSDIPAYNLANGRMWMIYSIPYFIAGLLALFYPVHENFIVASVIVLFFACIPGLFFLIRHYRKIEKKYTDPKRLDKIDPFC